MAIVYVPSPLRRVTGGQSKLSVPGQTIRELLTGLERQYPGIRQQVCDETGEVRTFINVFVNGTEIRQLQGLSTPLKDADEVSIIPAMAGGTDMTESRTRGRAMRPSNRVSRFRGAPIPRFRERWRAWPAR